MNNRTAYALVLCVTACLVTYYVGYQLGFKAATIKEDIGHLAKIKEDIKKAYPFPGGPCETMGAVRLIDSLLMTCGNNMKWTMAPACNKEGETMRDDFGNVVSCKNRIWGKQ